MDHINNQNLPYKAAVYDKFKKKNFMQLNLQSGKPKKNYKKTELSDKLNKQLTTEEKSAYDAYNEFANFDKWDKYIQPGRQQGKLIKLRELRQLLRGGRALDDGGADGQDYGG